MLASPITIWNITYDSSSGLDISYKNTNVFTKKGRTILGKILILRLLTMFGKTQNLLFSQEKCSKSQTYRKEKKRKSTYRYYNIQNVNILEHFTGNQTHTKLWRMCSSRLGRWPWPNCRVYICHVNAILKTSCYQFLCQKV